MSDPYLDEVNKKPLKIINWAETLILLIVILGYCTLQGYLEVRDEREKLAELARHKHMTCQIRHNQDVHQFDCTVINEKLAVIQ